MELIENLKNDFTEIFNENPTNIYFSPGRVNLIGEHTDYNGGNVFPCALSIGTYGLTTKRDDKKVRLYSNNFKDIEKLNVGKNTKFSEDILKVGGKVNDL